MNKIKRYLPLVVLVSISLLASFALAYGVNNFSLAVHFFMGFFLCQFAMLKLFDLPSFAEGFQMYDLLAKRCKAYGYVYPFIELILGLLYFSFAFSFATNLCTIVVMGVGVISVIKALREGLDVRCACMGTNLNVPLSTVTLFEDITMIAMAAYMLI